VVLVVAIENVLVAAVSVFALALSVIAILAALFAGSIGLTDLFILSGSFDLAILALFYGFTLRR